MEEMISPETHCCVHGCNSKFSFKNANKCKLFEFPPMDINVNGIIGRELFFKWIRAVKLPSKYTPVMRVCSLHFTPEDYFYKDGKKVLKYEAVPSQNLPLIWRNKFYPRSYGRLVKCLEYRGIGRLRLCLQAKLVRRIKRRTAAIDRRTNRIKLNTTTTTTSSKNNNRHTTTTTTCNSTSNNNNNGSGSGVLQADVEAERGTDEEGSGTPSGPGGGGGGLEVCKAFSLVDDTTHSTMETHSMETDLLSDVYIKEEPLSPTQGDSVEEMLAKMNCDTPPPVGPAGGGGGGAPGGRTSGSGMTSLTDRRRRRSKEGEDDGVGGGEEGVAVVDTEDEDEFCNICGSDSCCGHGDRGEEVDVEVSQVKFECNLCNKCFRTYRQLNAHNLSHFEKRRYPLDSANTLSAHKCKVCSLLVPDSTTLTDHILTQHSNNNPHVCMLCEKSFGSRQGLMIHVNVEHTLDRVDRCRLCAKLCPNRKELDQHVRSHSLSKKQFSCRECGLMFRSKAACWAHLNRHTRERCEQGFRCDTCCRVLSTKTTLREHMTIHSGEKPFQCLLCHKKIRHRANFIIHVQSHCLGGGGLYSCVCCGASYSRKSQLNRHIASVHPEDVVHNTGPTTAQHHQEHHQQRYPCIICGMTFPTETKFVRHALTHNASLDDNLTPLTHSSS